MKEKLIYLLGTSDTYTMDYLQNKGQQFKVSYTYDPCFSNGPGHKRVIRLKEEDEVIEILVGHFQLPSYEKHDE